MSIAWIGWSPSLLGWRPLLLGCYYRPVVEGFSHQTNSTHLVELNQLLLVCSVPKQSRQTQSQSEKQVDVSRVPATSYVIQGSQCLEQPFVSGWDWISRICRNSPCDPRVRLRMKVASPSSIESRKAFEALVSERRNTT